MSNATDAQMPPRSCPPSLYARLKNDRFGKNPKGGFVCVIWPDEMEWLKAAADSSIAATRNHISDALAEALNKVTTELYLLRREHKYVHIVTDEIEQARAVLAAYAKEKPCS